MDKRGRVASFIVVGLFLLTFSAVLILSEPTITGAVVGYKPIMSSLITITFLLAAVSIVPRLGSKKEQVSSESFELQSKQELSIPSSNQSSFSDIDDRLSQIDNQLDKLF